MRHNSFYVVVEYGVSQCLFYAARKCCKIKKILFHQNSIQKSIDICWMAQKLSEIFVKIASDMHWASLRFLLFIHLDQFLIVSI